MNVSMNNQNNAIANYDDFDDTFSIGSLSIASDSFANGINSKKKEDDDNSICSVDVVEDILNNDDKPQMTTALMWKDEPIFETTIVTTVSNDSSQNTSANDDGIDYSNNNKHENHDEHQQYNNLLQGELLDFEAPTSSASASSTLKKVRFVDQSAEDQSVTYSPLFSHQQHQATAHHPSQTTMDPISCMMEYLHRTESDRQLVQAAFNIVDECQVRHMEGKQHKYQNVSGAIFERLIALLGAQKFQEIYQRSQQQKHRQGMAGQQVDEAQPKQTDDTLSISNLQFAIAYGIHIAQLASNKGGGGGTSSSEDYAVLVQRGVEAVNSMTNEEKNYFWQFIHRQQM